jgi:hypothetical protein
MRERKEEVGREREKEKEGILRLRFWCPPRILGEFLQKTS